MDRFPLMGCLQIICEHFFANLCNPFPFQKAKSFQNLTTESGSKQSTVKSSHLGSVQCAWVLRQSV